MSGSSLVDYWLSEGSFGYNHLQNKFFSLESGHTFDKL